MEKKIKRYIIALAKILLSITALIIVFRKIDIRELEKIISSSNIFLLLTAVVFFILSKIVAAFRLNIFLRNEQVHISDKFNLRLYLLGMYYNLFLPGGISGDGYKVYLLNKLTKVKVKDILHAVITDRVTGLLALLCINLVLTIYLPVNSVLKVLLWLAVPLVLLLFYFIIERFFKQYRTSFTKTNLQAFFVQLLQLASAFFIMKSIGIDQYYGSYLFIFLLSSVVAIIPFTIGGIGAREVTFLISARILELNPEQSLSISVLFFLITAVVSLAGIYYSIRFRNIE